MSKKRSRKQGSASPVAQTKVQKSEPSRVSPSGLQLSPAVGEAWGVDSQSRIPLTLAEVKSRYAPPATLGTPEDIRMACDNQLESSGVYSLLQHSFAMGQMPQAQFLGYGTLQQISQSGMIRACVETTSDDMTRNWIELRREGEDEEKSERQTYMEALGLKDELSNEEKASKLTQLDAEMDKLNLQKVFHDAATLVGYMGGCLIYIDTGVSDPDELKQPLNISSASAELKDDRPLRFLPIDPINIFPGIYNSTNPLRADYFSPKTWWILGTEVHTSRLLRLVANEVPMLLKPAYNFMGLAQAQILWDYVMHFNSVRIASQRLLGKFSLTVMKTDMANILTQAGGIEELDRRIALLVRNRSNDGVQVIDKEMEDILKLETPISGVTDVVRQSLEILAVMNRTPAVKLLGISPSGFNATGESDLRNYYDHILGQQEKILRPAITKILKILQIKLFGKIDSTITFDFSPLSEEDRSATVTTQKTVADTLSVLIQNQVIAPEEARKVLADDPDSGFSDLDVDDAPESVIGQQEMQPEFVGGAQGQEVPEEGAVLEGPKEQADDVEQVVLNGAQVSSMVDIVTKVAAGELPRDSGIAILQAAFPISEEVARNIIGSSGLDAQNNAAGGQQSEQSEPEEDNASKSVIEALTARDGWITVGHKDSDEDGEGGRKGQHVFIDGEGRVKAGLGGKFNEKHISEIKSKKNTGNTSVTPIKTKTQSSLASTTQEKGSLPITKTPTSDLVTEIKNSKTGNTSIVYHKQQEDAVKDFIEGKLDENRLYQAAERMAAIRREAISGDFSDEKAFRKEVDDLINQYKNSKRLNDRLKTLPEYKAAEREIPQKIQDFMNLSVSEIPKKKYETEKELFLSLNNGVSDGQLFNVLVNYNIANFGNTASYQDIIDWSKDYFNNIYAEKPGVEERKKTANPQSVDGVTQGPPMSHRKADEKSANPRYSENKKYQNNCQSCVLAFELRCRGYDVEARPFGDSNLSLDLSRGTNKAFTDIRMDKMAKTLYVQEKSIKTVKEYKKALKKIDDIIQPNQRFCMGWTWSKGDVGHIVSMVKGKDGVLTLIDPQIGEYHQGIDNIYKNYFKTSGNGIRMVSIFRTDNTKINDKYLGVLKRK